MSFSPFFLLAVGIAISSALFLAGYRPWRRAVLRARLEGQLPEALRAIADAVAGGMDLRGAFGVVASMGARPLSDVARRVLALSEVGGMTVEEALWRTAEEVGSPNFKRFALIVAEAVRSGARLPEVLGAAARSFATVVEFRRDLAAQLRPYVLLFYAVLGVFVVLSDLLIYFMIPQLAKLSSSVASSAIRPAVVNALDALTVMFFSAIVQSIVGGLIVGRIVYFSASAGLVHSAVASAISTAALLAPLWVKF